MRYSLSPFENAKRRLTDGAMGGSVGADAPDAAAPNMATGDGTNDPTLGDVGGNPHKHHHNMFTKDQNMIVWGYLAGLIVVAILVFCLTIVKRFNEERQARSQMMNNMVEHQRQRQNARESAAANRAPPDHNHGVHGGGAVGGQNAADARAARNYEQLNMDDPRLQIHQMLAWEQHEREQREQQRQERERNERQRLRDEQDRAYAQAERKMTERGDDADSTEVSHEPIAATNPSGMRNPSIAQGDYGTYELDTETDPTESSRGVEEPQSNA